jgi:hypothetical protein
VLLSNGIPECAGDGRVYTPGIARVWKKEDNIPITRVLLRIGESLWKLINTELKHFSHNCGNHSMSLCVEIVAIYGLHRKHAQSKTREAKRMKIDCVITTRKHSNRK